MIRTLALVVLGLAVAPACSHKKEPHPRTKDGSGSGSVTEAPQGAPGSGLGSGSGSGSGAGAPAKLTYKELGRADFNRWAVRQNLPVYWIADANNDKTIQPDEVSSLLFYPTQGHWVEGGAFTKDFEVAYQQILDASKKPPDVSDDGKRQIIIGKDLDQGRATLIRSDLTKLSADDKAFVGHMLKIADLIDKLYADQNGSAVLADKVPSDPASQSLYRRDHGPRCVGPLTENDPSCSAIAGNPKPIVSVYPDTLAGTNGKLDQQAKEFCGLIEDKAKNAAQLTDPFTVVRADSAGKLTAVPYSEAYKPQMTAIADELDRAAAAIKDASEKALVTYLTESAKSFRTNNWLPADEAWAKMTAENSKWYVRVGADETYWEPCAHKAGFHLTFARINEGSLIWQAKLKPIQQDMEKAIADAAGAPYRARTVTFHLPDFVDIVINAGDDRNPIGGTIGQSLPNFGPIAAEGRGRTLAMVNLTIDADSLDTRRQQAESLFDKSTAALFTGAKDSSLMGTILHEATHNLGPANEYKIGPKKADELFGGPLAAMLEELKAQTGALFLLSMMESKKLLTDEEVLHSYVDDIVWAFGQLSQGMRTGSGERKPYPSLSAIQIGLLMDKGALTWDAKAKAANNKDTGAYHLDPKKLVAAADDMMKLVGGIKARGDVKAANDLIKKYVDSEAIVPHKTISERWLRFPKASYVYAVSL